MKKNYPFLKITSLNIKQLLLLFAMVFIGLSATTSYAQDTDGDNIPDV